MAAFDDNFIDSKNEFNLDIDKYEELEYEELKYKLDKISNEINEEIYKMKYNLYKLNNIFHENNSEICKNDDFNKQELIEENFDILFHKYKKLKLLFKKGREIRFYKEFKENDINKEKILMRNLHLKIYYGIKY
jgi:hypothetical protein